MSMNNPLGGMTPMNLGAITPPTVPAAAPVMAPMSEGVSKGTKLASLRMAIQSRGYVFGYIMGNAPATAFYPQKKKSKDGDTSVLVCRQTKPTKPLAVLMALPKNAVMKGSALADPSDIAEGNVDFDPNSKNNDLLFQMFTVPAAISYISAFGNKLPEFAPNVSDASKQWSVEDILRNRPQVSYVYVKATKNNRASSADKASQFRFSLKTSDSVRRTLFTRKNFVPLRAVEHTPVTINNDQDAMRVNECAFGALKYRKKKAEGQATQSMLDWACAQMPRLIWKQTYEIVDNDGMKSSVEGIGSAFFMSGSDGVNGNGEPVQYVEPTYYPWYMTSAKGQTPSKVTEIVYRELAMPKEDGKQPRMVTKPITLKGNQGHPLFKPYDKFFKEALKFASEDEIYALGSKQSASKKRNDMALSDDASSAMAEYIQKHSSDIQSVLDAFATTVAINAAK